MEVVQAAAELVLVMAEALGADAYFPIFQQLHWPPLHEKLHGSQPAGLRAALIGRSACRSAGFLIRTILELRCHMVLWHLQLGGLSAQHI